MNDLTNYLSFSQCPTNCPSSSCDQLCNTVATYLNQITADHQALQRDATTASTDIQNATQLATQLQQTVQTDFSGIATDLAQVETDLGAICTAYTSAWGGFSDVCNSAAGQAAVQAFNKNATPAQKAAAAAAKQAAMAKKAVPAPAKK